MDVQPEGFAWDAIIICCTCNSCSLSTARFAHWSWSSDQFPIFFPLIYSYPPSHVRSHATPSLVQFFAHSSYSPLQHCPLPTATGLGFFTTFCWTLRSLNVMKEPSAPVRPWTKAPGPLSWPYSTASLPWASCSCCSPQHYWVVLKKNPDLSCPL